MAWLGLVATLIWNYIQHRRGRPTICSLTRRVLPPWAFIGGWGALTAYMLRHILGGYPKES